MKKTILTLATVFVLNAVGYSSILLSDSFSYIGANLVGASGSPWVNHSGTAPITLVNGTARLTSGNSEDANSALSGAPYDTINNPTVGYLYSSMSVTVSNTPGTDGTYISHFKDGAFGFRCRVYLLTNGAAPGFFRFGIASTNSASTTLGFTPWATDTQLGVPYSVVTRYNITNGESVMWIDPVDENSTSITNVPPNPDSVIPIVAYALRQSGGSGTAYLDNLKVATQFNEIAGANTAPLISSILAQSAPANAAVGPVNFTVEDGELAASSLIVSNSNDNPGLIGSVVLGGSDTNRTVTVTPASNQQGSANITIYASDATNTTATSFRVRFGAPSISAVPSQYGITNAPAGPISFTVSDAEGDTISVNTNYTNPGLISSVVVSGSGSARTITITPALDQVGASTISLYASDGFNTVTQSFTVTFSPVIGLIFSEPFNYPDGDSLYLSGPWLLTSGTAGQAYVTNGSVLLIRTNGEALNTGTGFGAAYAPSNGVVVYSAFTIRVAEIPSSAGNYFALFKDTTTSNFRARLSVRTLNAAPGHYRVGIANQSADPSAEVPNDLATNTTYLVVSRFNTVTGESTVWVNPVSSAIGGVVATDSTSTMTVVQYGLRQAAGMGHIFLDDLKVGTSLADVAAIPALNQTLSHQVLNGELVLSWGAPLFALQTASTVAGPFTTIPSATSPYTNSLTDTQKYFRLKY